MKRCISILALLLFLALQMPAQEFPVKRAVLDTGKVNPLMDV